MHSATSLAKIQKILSEEDILLASVFGVLGDRNRLRIMKLLLVEGELCVSDLAGILDISVSAVSQHLRVLEMSGLVSGERMGQMTCYRPISEHPKIKAIIRLITS